MDTLEFICIPIGLMNINNSVVYLHINKTHVIRGEAVNGDDRGFR